MRWRVNMMVGRRTVGGWLGVDDERLAFVPHRLEAWLGGGPWSASLHDVRGIRIVAPNDREFPAGLRRRMAIDTADGTETLFLVNRIDSVVARLRASMPRVSD
jgi:hypothetical protein